MARRQKSPDIKFTTVEDVHAHVAKMRVIALAKTKEDWGTSDTSVIMEALRQTIPNSLSPGDAAHKARALLPQ